VGASAVAAALEAEAATFGDAVDVGLITVASAAPVDAVAAARFDAVAAARRAAGERGPVATQP